jgi:hypothetical protein
MTRTGKIGRNDPCPCGSGLKYKRCCLPRGEARAAPYSIEDRARALAALDELTDHQVDHENDDALDEFLGCAPLLPENASRELELMSDGACDMWFWFDRPLEDGRLVVDLLLGQRERLTPGMQRYLELARDTTQRLYEVTDTRPGRSITLKDLLDGQEITVHEKRGSLQLQRSTLLAARVLTRGASGQPELEQGLLPLPLMIREALVDQLRELRESFRRRFPRLSDAAFFKQEAPPFFHSAWATVLVDPPIPQLATTDGEPVLITRDHYDVLDRVHLETALDAAPDLEREQPTEPWIWTGTNRRGEPISLGWLHLAEGTLTLETTAVSRSERGRTRLAAVAGESIRHRATSHEDPTQALKERLRWSPEPLRRPPPDPDLPPDLTEDLVLELHAKHSRRWLDEEIPALDGRTPRQAASDPARRDRLERLLRDLEGQYERALRDDAPAYDPSWMREELGLMESVDAAHPPPLAPERWVEQEPALGPLVGQVVARLRGAPGFDVTSTVVEPGELEDDLTVRRFLAGQPLCDADGPATPPVPGTLARLRWMVGLELHHRKIFWVEPSLAFLLGQTELDVVGDQLRAPFPTFALVFTDRHTLSLAERHLATIPGDPQAGHLLRVLTVLVDEHERSGHRELRLGFAPDALGAAPATLVEHALELVDGEKIILPGSPGGDEPLVIDGAPVPRQRPLPGLLRVVLNAILYATSAGVEPEVRRAPPRPPSPRKGQPARMLTSEDVFFLPGHIEISHVRRLEELARVPSGRQLMHRHLVRGHWRRANPGWKDQRVRWIAPYWQGPDLAAIIERTYRLKS